MAEAAAPMDVSEAEALLPDESEDEAVDDDTEPTLGLPPLDACTSCYTT